MVGAGLHAVRGVPFATPPPEMVNEVYMTMEYEGQESLRKGGGLRD